MKAVALQAKRIVAAVMLAAVLLFSIASCSDQPAAGVSSGVTAGGTALATTEAPTPTPTEEPTPEPTPTPTPEPTPAPTPAPVDGLDNSGGAFPNIVRDGGALFYIYGNTEIGYTLSRMRLDGTRRTPLLTEEQGLKLFKKLKKNATAFGMQNTLYIKDKRIYFLCMTVETISGANKNTVYIMSVDLAAKNLKIEKQLMKPDDQQKFWKWYMDNSSVSMSDTVLLTGFRTAIGQDGWNYYTNANRQIVKARADGSEETPVYDAAQVDRFAVQGEWIYFEKKGTDGIYRVSVGGGEETRVGGANNTDHVFSGFAVLGDWIYYNEQDEKTKGNTLHKLKIDGSENVVVTTKYSPYSFQIINNLIFYNTVDSGKIKGSWNLRAMSLDGTGDRLIK